jgi:hypothetical protein
MSVERSFIMFGKAVVGGMIIVALMSIAPGLAGLAFIVIPIVIVILQNKEERAANEAKYGWDPIRDKFENLPKEQKDRVKQGWDDDKTRKREEITQMCRNQEAIPGTFSQRLSGNADYYPSIKEWQSYSIGLPPALKKRLMAAAEAESWELSKSKAVIICDKNAYPQARQTLINIFNECEVVKRKSADKGSSNNNSNYSNTVYTEPNAGRAALCTVNLVSAQNDWDDDW